MEVYRHSIFVRCDRDSEDTDKLLLRYFSIRRRSGGGECSVSLVSPGLYCVSFRSQQVLDRVLAQEEHVVQIGHSNQTLKLQPQQPCAYNAKKVPMTLERISGQRYEEDLTTEIKLKNPDHYCHLIKPCKQKVLEKEHPEVKITQVACCLKLHGPSTSVLTVKGILQESLNNIKTIKVSQPQAIISFLISNTPQKIADAYLLPSGICTILDVSAQDGSVVLHSLSSSDIRNAVQILSERITVEVLDLDEDLEPFTHTNQFEDLLKEVNQHPEKMQVFCEVSGEGEFRKHKITLVGQPHDKISAKEKILTHLHQVSEEKEYLNIESPPELFQNLPQLMDFLGLAHLKATVTWVPQSKKLELKGSTRAIEEAKVALSKNLVGVQCKTVHLCWPEAFSYFNGAGSEYLKSLKHIFHCHAIVQPKEQPGKQLVCLHERGAAPESRLHSVKEKEAKLEKSSGSLSKKKKGFGMGFGSTDKEAYLVAHNVIVHIVHDNKVTRFSDIIINPICKAKTESTLLSAAGEGVKEELAKLVQSQAITITRPGALPCRLLVHFPCLGVSAVKEYLSKTIEEGKNRGYSDITIFLDRNELYNDEATLASDIMRTAINTMAAEDVLRIILPQEQLFKAFITKAQCIWPTMDLFLHVSNPFGDMTCVRGKFGQDDAESLHNHSELCEPVTIQLFCKDMTLLDKAESALGKHYLSFMCNECVINPYIRTVDKAVLSEIHKLKYTYKVNVTVHDGVIVFNSLAANTSQASLKACEMLKTAWEVKQEKIEKIFSQHVQWIINNKEKHPVAFFNEDNYKAEIQHMCMKDDVTIKGEEQETLMVSLKNMTATNLTSGMEYKIKRTEVLESNLPGKWDEMGCNDLKKVPVDIETLEHIWVERMFNKTMSNRKIFKIERIQNKNLWEKFLLFANNDVTHHFYGVKHQDVERVETGGFFRPDETFFSSERAQGRGIYFYADASAAQRKCDFNVLKQKVMFLARVKTGEFTLGRKGMEAPPPINPIHPEVLYHSVVDNVSTPSVFVVFNADQTYPEYSITYTE